MSYTALYRKFRPDTFADVKGQEHIVKTLRNQIHAARIGHAYLFCGTRGTGKTTVAKILARAVNCENPENGSPCNRCETCRGIQDRTSMNVIEIDAASNNGVDNIREIREEVAYRPTQGKYKVYIIDEVHMLSTGAFNALLKTLEEPPAYVIFILATTEAHKIPVTILSRCQRYDFRRITIDTIADRLNALMLQEKTAVEERALRYIAKAADGSMRDALSLLDQCIAFHLGETLTYEMVLDVLGTLDLDVFSALLRKVIKRDVSGCIRDLESLVLQGKEMGQLVSDFTWYMRNLLLVKTSGGTDTEEILDVSAENRQQLAEESEMVDTPTLMRFIRIFSELSNQIRYASQKRILVEIALIKLCRPAMEVNLDTVLDRVRVIEEQLEQGIFQVPPAAVPKVSPSTGEAGDSQPPAPVPPQKAAPEDLQQVKSQWRTIIGQTQGRFKSLLQSAIPKYNGQTGEAKLFVEFTNDLAQKYVDNSEANLEAKKELVDVIIEKIGKSVEVEFLLNCSGPAAGLAEITVDDILENKIHMNIVIEDET